MGKAPLPTTNVFEELGRTELRIRNYAEMLRANVGKDGAPLDFDVRVGLERELVDLQCVCFARFLISGEKEVASLAAEIEGLTHFPFRLPDLIKLPWRTRLALWTKQPFSSALPFSDSSNLVRSPPLPPTLLLATPMARSSKSLPTVSLLKGVLIQPHQEWEFSLHMRGESGRR